MPNNYRKIPKGIIEKIDTIKSNEIIVWSAIKIKESEIKKWNYKKIWITSVSWEVIFQEEVIPGKENWRTSKKNVLWYTIKNKNQPKITKEIYLWERPWFWDWSKGSSSVYRDMEVYPSEKFAPKEISLNIELLEKENINWELYFIFKICTKGLLEKNDKDFSKDILFHINLLQENIKKIDVFAYDSSKEEYLDTLDIDWDIFPPWERDSDLKKIIWTWKKISESRIAEIKERYDFILKLNPLKIIRWRSWMRSYFWAKFSDNLVVFENKDYWNALYILFDNWAELSKLSRTEIQNRPSGEFIRIPHMNNWKIKATSIINNKR